MKLNTIANSIALTIAMNPKSFLTANIIIETWMIFPIISERATLSMAKFFWNTPLRTMYVEEKTNDAAARIIPTLTVFEYGKKEMNASVKRKTNNDANVLMASALLSILFSSASIREISLAVNAYKPRSANAPKKAKNARTVE